MTSGQWQHEEVKKMRKPDQRRTASWGLAACASGSSPLQNMFGVDDQIKGVREGVEVCGGLGWDLSLKWCNIGFI